MSLTDKIIKNTSYYFLSQIAGLIFPLVLTPFIISKIGLEEFAIYALVFGFIGGFSLLDLSISTSFVKFISEHYYKKEFENLNRVINTGTFYNLLFSLIVLIVVFFSVNYIISTLNIPAALHEKAIFALYISLSIFFVTNSSSMFGAIITSLQKMYLNSVTWLIISSLNSVSIIILLISGLGLKAILVSQLVAYTINTLFTLYFAGRNLTEMKFSPSLVRISTFRRLFNFGIQMQISKLATFASEKYDEFLLAYFSVLNNVAFFNIGARISRLGRFLPLQLLPQVAPVAAELNSRDDRERLVQLFHDTTRYLTLISFPIFTYLFFFADVVILSWMGEGYGTSANILRILATGQLINMMLSAPSNSIIPNTGVPKYQMREGLISLVSNLVLSYLLIKYYGIIGAAWGNSLAAVISSVYIFCASIKYFRLKQTSFLKTSFLKPLVISVFACAVLFLMYTLSDQIIISAEGRLINILYLTVTFLIYFITVFILFLFSKYILDRDKEIFTKIILHIFPFRSLANRRLNKYKTKLMKPRDYEGELVSLLIVTHNRCKFLKKNISSLLPTLAGINYEIIIWDNNSTDETKEYLKMLMLDFPRIRAVLNEKNIGTGAKGKLFELAKGEYIFGIDDDIWNYPLNWVRNMIRAYNVIPRIGYLATDVIQDDTTDGAKLQEHNYNTEYFDQGKIKFLSGPAGGWCFLVSRSVYKKVGELKQIENRIFYGEDADYIFRMVCRGFRFGILGNVKLYHAHGPIHNKEYKEVFTAKMEDIRNSKDKIFMIKEFFYKWFNLKYYYNKLLDLAEIEIHKEEGNKTE